jgi:cytochrome c biogenesis protein CcdA
MARLPVLFLFLLALLGFGPPAAAQPGSTHHMRVSLVAESTSAPAGSTVTLAFVMRPERGWHGYWRNPGDAGAAPRIEWRLPEGWRTGALLYPVPTRLSVAGLMNYVFAAEHALLVDLEVPATAEPGVVFPVDARIDYLVCTNLVCVPETAQVTIELTTAVAGQTAPSAPFRQWRERLPQSLDYGGAYSVEGDRIRFAVRWPERVVIDRGVYLFPITENAIEQGAAQVIGRAGDRLIVETRAGRGIGALRMIEGVVRYGPDRGFRFAFHPGAVPAATSTIVGAPPVDAGAGGGEGPGLLAALLGALLGGLILNIMPCVFPILSLKALGLARAGGTESKARREALAYAAGVVLTCLALGALLLALRAGGAAVGWAFQLQDPRVILLLLLLVTAIALNLAGLFQLPMLAGGDGLARRGGAMGAFFTGALAAFIATPCTGPFMGAALGAALVLPPVGALAVFAGLGLGLALPFLALGFIPALRRRLPRPGAWMETLQRILAVPMFLTAVGLAWILGRQTGADGMAFGLLGVLILALGLWWLGRGGRWLAGLLILASAAPLLLIRQGPPAPLESPLPAEPFSEARLAALRAAGTPVFVYFTADWCLTCKVNERGALASAEVADAFRSRGIRVLVGDWTSGDAAIGRFLAAQGRSGVPLYLYYAPRRDAEVLPQILTTARLTSL